MANKHYQKWVLQMPFGFLLTAGGILIIMYAANKRATDEWLIWGIISITVINSGLALLGNAYVHKVKSDLIRKQKTKDKTSTAHAEEF
jgi:uncharacterized membrane protein HdeD (DUF308 family)